MMTKKEYMEQISGKSLDDAKVKKMESVYGTEFPELVRKIISNSEETEFFDDDTRILSFDEMVDAEADLHMAFKEKGLFPVADCGDNDFIVYHFVDNIWSKFNIIDETVFGKKSSLGELLK